MTRELERALRDELRDGNHGHEGGRELAELVLLPPAGELPAADRDPVQVYLASLTSGASRRVMAAALARMAGLLAGEGIPPSAVPWHELGLEHALALRAVLIEEYRPATVNRYLAALRGVLRACWLLGRMGAEDYHRVSTVRNVRFENLPAGRALSPGELAGLFDACRKDGTPAGARDAALLSILYGGGLRRDEAAHLALDDVDLAEAVAIRVRRAKGRRERMAYLPPGGRAALEHWLVHRGDLPGPLWTQIRRGGHLKLPPRGLSAQAIADVCTKRSAEAKVELFTPHDLRRSFCSHLLDAGVDLATVQRLVGHRSPTTTVRYDRRGEETKREAVTALHIAYSQKH